MSRHDEFEEKNNTDDSKLLKRAGPDRSIMSKKNSMISESSSSFQTRSPLLHAAIASPDYESFLSEIS